jgi:hypothetical protein
MHWLLFITMMAVVVIPIALVAMQEQRWFKKILFYHFPKFLRPISHQLKPINVYYDKLTPEERKRFEWRVYYFLDTTRIEFRHFRSGQLFNYNAIRYLIASVATQMTLFLTEDCFDAFNRIIIYPDTYYSPVTKKFHKGETNPAAGYIILSWNSFYAGFIESSDGVNLLMHELAHALWLENKLFDYELFDETDLERYRLVARKIMEEMHSNENHFFRKYASINEDEFFAVSVENFFERPVPFKKTLPELYSALTFLLKHDPIIHLNLRI